jgi:hypothetical protein
MSKWKLLPIEFVSQQRPLPPSRHSFVGEASTGRWAVLKFKSHLLGREFIWITDCSGVTKFFKTDYEATHTIQRWKLELLRFDFAVVHRPGQMLTDCDMLSRHNTWTSEWRTQQEAQEEPHEKESDPPNTKLPNYLFAIIVTDLEQAGQSPRIPRTRVNPNVTGDNKTVNRTLLTKTCDRARTLWIIGQGSETATIAMENLGLEPLRLKSTNKDDCWQSQADTPGLKAFLARSDRDS